MYRNSLHKLRPPLNIKFDQLLTPFEGYEILVIQVYRSIGIYPSPTNVARKLKLNLLLCRMRYLHNTSPPLPPEHLATFLHYSILTRLPFTMDSSPFNQRASLGGLPFELLGNICEYVHLIHKSSSFDLALINHTFMLRPQALYFTPFRSRWKEMSSSNKM